MDIQKIRKKLDTIDDKIVDLIGKRKDIVINEVAVYKCENRKSSYSPKREAEIMQRTRERGYRLGLNHDVVGKVYGEILSYCRKIEERQIMNLIEESVKNGGCKKKTEEGMNYYTPSGI